MSASIKENTALYIEGHGASERYVLSLDSVFGSEQELGGSIELRVADNVGREGDGHRLLLATSPAAPCCRSRIKQRD